MRPFLFAGLLLAVPLLAAPAASAGVVGFADETCDNLHPAFMCLLSCQEMDPQLILCYTIDGIPFPPNGIPDLLPDADNDGIPDVLEVLVCGPALVGDNLGASGQASCATPSDLVVDPDTTVVTEPVFTTLGIVLGIVFDAYGLVDTDGDLVPDDAEPVLCQVENRNLPQDGSCVGDDYTP